MLIIRLTRRGRRNDPSFKLVVTEHANPVKGKFLEELGFLNPKTKAKSFKSERILYWISKGAKCSATVNNLLVSEGVIEGKKVKAWRPKKKEGQEVSKAETKAVKTTEEKESEAEPADEENKEASEAGQKTEEPSNVEAPAEGQAASETAQAPEEKPQT